MMEASDSAQPTDAGQGASEGTSPLEQYLAGVPEDYRPHVEPFVRDVEKNTNQKFQEHAEYRKGWEPYEELNLQDYDPEGLGQLLEQVEAWQDPDKFKEWWMNAGRESGFLNEIISQLQDSDSGDEDEDWDEGDEPQLDINSIKEAVSELIDQKLSPFQQREFEREEQEDINYQSNQIDEQMKQLEQEYGEFGDEGKQAIYRFAYAHADTSDDPIQAGFEDYQRLVAGIENSTVTQRINTPQPAGPAGPANTNSEPPKTMEDARSMAMERLAQQRQI